MKKTSLSKHYIASAPASLKLMGEHAVLFGQPAIVCSVNHRITVTLEERNDDLIFISSFLGNHKTSLNNIEVVKPLQFVLAALKHFSHLMRNGCNLTIESDFLSTVGLGSSAAVTVSTVGAIAMWLGLKLDNLKMLELTMTIVLQIQSVGSGADLAASIYGGLIYYKHKPIKIIKLPNWPDLTLVYSGSKTTTVESVSRVNHTFEELRGIQNHIYELIGACIDEAIKAIGKGDWGKFGTLCNIHHGLQEALCTGTSMLSEIVYELRRIKGIAGAKISGSGFGDCVVAIGKIPQNTFPINDIEKNANVVQIPVSIEPRGVIYHE